MMRVFFVTFLVTGLVVKWKKQASSVNLVKRAEFYFEKKIEELSHWLNMKINNCHHFQVKMKEMVLLQWISWILDHYIKMLLL